jgi:predicted  nucleic acid-binding Zn-ribbon protein
MNTRRFIPLLSAFVLLAACETQSRARIDSLQATTAEQLELTTTLSAQKDSLARVIVDADDFIMAIDSQIRTVKGLPTAKRVSRRAESPIEDQIERRREVLTRVSALVERAKLTANQLAASRKREAALKGEKDALQEQLSDAQQKLTDTEARLSDDHTMIGDLGATIERQMARIAELELRVDSLITETRTMGERHYRAYYVVGTEKELLEKGIIEHEGGANLLIMHPGRTLQPARKLDAALFTPIDQRAVREIQLPDSTRRYRLVSRQNLDKATVRRRDKTTFTGPLQISDAESFWAGSRYLILVQR